MADFASKIQSFTCISDENKQKIIAKAASLSEKGQAEIVAILEKGETKKKALEDEHKQQTLDHIKKYLAEVAEFKRGPLRKAFKDAESFDHQSDEQAAEDLLKDL